MPDEARELLKRLVAWDAAASWTSEHIADIVADTRAFLAREQDGPVAEGYVYFERQLSGKWITGEAAAEDIGRQFTVRIPVPQSLLSPIVGSVVENQEGK